jgi:radical SAM protein with 4Fe4S-binding SPASM domain
MPKDKQSYYHDGLMRSACFTNNFLTRKKWIPKWAVVINPDLSIAYCEGCFVKGKKPLTKYRNPQEIFNEFRDVVDKVRWIPLYEDCLECGFYKKKICHGTCLANKVSADFWND